MGKQISDGDALKRISTRIREIAPNASHALVPREELVVWRRVIRRLKRDLAAAEVRISPSRAAALFRGDLPESSVVNSVERDRKGQ